MRYLAQESARSVKITRRIVLSFERWTNWDNSGRSPRSSVENNGVLWTRNTNGLYTVQTTADFYLRQEHSFIDSTAYRGLLLL